MPLRTGAEWRYTMGKSTEADVWRIDGPAGDGTDAFVGERVLVTGSSLLGNLRSKVLIRRGDDGITVFFEGPMGTSVQKLLGFPISVGTKWTRKEGQECRIEAVDRQVSTSIGDFANCIVVVVRVTNPGFKALDATETWCRGVGMVRDKFSELKSFNQLQRAPDALLGGVSSGRSDCQLLGEEVSPGFATVDSTPKSLIFWKGEKLGETPILRIKLPAGCIELLAKSTTPPFEKKLRIRVEPDRSLRYRFDLGYTAKAVPMPMGEPSANNTARAPVTRASVVALIKTMPDTARALELMSALIEAGSDDARLLRVHDQALAAQPDRVSKVDAVVFGYLTVQVSPEKGSVVFINGRQIDGRVESQPVVPGRHEIVVRNDGLNRTSRLTVDVAAEGRITRRVDLFQ
jgi:hypothetical protein